MKAIVFTFDGVLCDTKTIGKNAFKAALRESGYYWNDEINSAYERNARPRTWLDKAVQKKLVRNDDVENIELAFRSNVIDTISELQFPNRYSKRLESIKERYRLKLAIISDVDKKAILEFLRWTRLNELFDYVTCSGDVDGGSSNQIYARCFEKMGIAPIDVVSVENSHVGDFDARLAGVSKVVESSFYRFDQMLNDVEKALR